MLKREKDKVAMLEKENALLMDIVNSNINTSKNREPDAMPITNYVDFTKQLEKNIEDKITETLNSYQKTYMLGINTTINKMYSDISSIADILKDRSTTCGNMFKSNNELFIRVKEI